MKCRVCDSSIKEDYVTCDICKQQLHASCAGISRQEALLKIRTQLFKGATLLVICLPPLISVFCQKCGMLLEACHNKSSNLHFW